MKNFDKGTVIRTLLLLIALINQGLITFGKPILPISEDELNWLANAGSYWSLFFYLIGFYQKEMFVDLAPFSAIIKKLDSYSCLSKALYSRLIKKRWYSSFSRIIVITVIETTLLYGL